MYYSGNNTYYDAIITIILPVERFGCIANTIRRIIDLTVANMAVFIRYEADLCEERPVSILAYNSRRKNQIWRQAVPQPIELSYYRKHY